MMFEIWYLCTFLVLCSGVPIPNFENTSLYTRSNRLPRSVSLPQESNVRDVIKEIAKVQHLDKAVKAASQSRVVRSLDNSESETSQRYQTPIRSLYASASEASQHYQMPDRSLETSASETSQVYQRPDRSLEASSSKTSNVYQMPDRSLDSSSSEQYQQYQMPESSQYATYQESQQTPAYNGDRADWEDTLSAPGYSDNRSGTENRYGYSDNRASTDNRAAYSDNGDGYSNDRAGYSDNRASRKGSRYKRKDTHDGKWNRNEHYDGKWDGNVDGQVAQRRDGEDAPSEPLGPPGPYRYGYAVKDDDGNDFNQQEESNGSEVRGQYSVVLPDCRVLTVSYSVTSESGYVADVVYTPIDNCFGDTGTGPVSSGSENIESPEQQFVEAPLPTYGSGYRQ